MISDLATRDSYPRPLHLNLYRLRHPSRLRLHQDLGHGCRHTRYSLLRYPESGYRWLGHGNVVWYR